MVKDDVMKKQENLLLRREDDLIVDQLVELTSRSCGLLIIDDKHRLLGTFTNGNLRSTLKISGEGIFKLCVTGTRGQLLQMQWLRLSNICDAPVTPRELT